MAPWPSLAGWSASAITATPCCVRREAGDGRFFSAGVFAAVVPAGAAAGAGAVVGDPAAAVCACAVAVVVTGVGAVGGENQNDAEVKTIDVGPGAVIGLLLSVGVDLERLRDQTTFSRRRRSVIDTDASPRAIERSNLGFLGLQRSRKRAASRAH